jgi:predicted dehydrogenase
VATVVFVTEQGAAHQGSYREALRDLDLIDRVQLMDPSGATFAESKAAVGAKCTGTFATTAELVANERPSLALVSMIAANAPPVITELLEAGIDVMAEKPACVRLADFKRLVALADERGAKLVLAFANRIRADMRDAHRIVRDGGIGDLYAVQATQVDDQTRIWAKKDGHNWTFERRLAGGGHLSWLGIHTLDLLRYLSGDEFAEIGAMAPVVGGSTIDVEDLAMLNIRFASGAHGSLFCGYLMDRKGHSSVTLYGSAGFVRINAAERGRVEWRRVSARGGEPIDRTFEYSTRGGGYTPWVERVLEACLGRTELPATAADGLAALRAVHAAYQSAATRSTVVL